MKNSTSCSYAYQTKHRRHMWGNFKMEIFVRRLKTPLIFPSWHQTLQWLSSRIKQTINGLCLWFKYLWLFVCFPLSSSLSVTFFPFPSHTNTHTPAHIHTKPYTHVHKHTHSHTHLLQFLHGLIIILLMVPCGCEALLIQAAGDTHTPLNTQRRERDQNVHIDTHTPTLYNVHAQDHMFPAVQKKLTHFII